MPVTLVCEQCGDSFTAKPSRSKGRRFCSQTCRLESARASRVDLTCETCGGSFSRPPSTSRGARFCSRACKDERQRTERITLHCETCGGAFTCPPAHSWRRFCSPSCGKDERTPTGSVILTCETCGEDFERTRSKADRRFCSPACYGIHKRAEVTLDCENCGGSFTRKPARSQGARFCSDRCHREARNTKIEKTCKTCGTSYQVSPYREESQFCSPSCVRRSEGPTDIELILYQILDSLGLNYIEEYPAGPYHLDAFLPIHKIALEADGERWHLNETAEERDQNRDLYLYAEGIRTVRFTGSDLHKRPGWCADEILREIEAVEEESWADL